MEHSASLRFAVVLSLFNDEHTKGLLKGAQRFFQEKGIPFDSDRDLVLSPGAFELPLLAQKLAKSGKYDGIICLGCLIKGDTAHFEFISLGTTIGIMQSMLNCEVPISFGVITTYNEQQAVERTLETPNNKGYEAANACWMTALALRKM